MSNPLALFRSYELERERWRRFVRRNYIQAFDLTGGNLLDVGCGNGFWGQLFHDEGFRVTGFDSEGLFIADGKRKFPDLTLDVHRVEDVLPYPPSDVVFCRALSHFYFRSLDEATAALAGLRKQVAGLLLISLYSDRSDQPRAGLRGGTLWHHTARDYTMMVENAGYQVWRLRSVNRYLQIGAR